MNTKVISFAFAFIALILLIPASAAQAASPIGEFGWQSMLSDDLGVDVSCGAGNMKYELLIKDRETDSPVAVNSAWFAVANKVTYTLTGQMTGPGPIIGPLCFNPDTQVYGINIDGGAAYYDFQTYNVLSNPAAVTRGHHVRVTVWVTPTSATTPEYEQISPMNIYTNVSPVYKYNLSAFPSTYGATGVTTVEFFVVNHLTGVNVLTPTITLSGGVGIKTIPAQTLADGWYHWMFYQHLNGSHNPGVYTETKELSTGLATSNGSFILDTAPPTIDATTGHVPTNPYPTEQVTVTGSASDALAGITNIKVYVDAILVCNQDFAYKNTPSACSVAVGPYLGGTTHPYYAVATDGAGNITTSPIQNFTVSRTPVLTATTNALCGSGTIDLSWTPSAGATSYDIQRDGGTVFNVGNVTAFSDSGLVADSFHSYRVRAVQGRGPSGWSESTEAVVASSCVSNVPPVASAGSNKAMTLPTNSVTISGASASDPDGSVVSTIWSKVSGPNVPTITGGTTLSPTFSGLIVGTYIFNLAVTDNSGQVTNSTMTITVSNPADPTMTVNTPPSPIPSGTPFTLSMTTSGATNVTWSRSDNGSPDWTNQPLGALFYNYGPTSWAGSMIDHTYVWTFTAYNAIGVQVSKTITLKILAAVPKLTVFPSSALFTSAPVGNTTTYNFSVAN
ncbi:MAG: PA14 domain protein, partial [Parcubacteria group bacterium GW2011_GWA2_47_7]